MKHCTDQIIGTNRRQQFDISVLGKCHSSMTSKCATPQSHENSRKKAVEKIQELDLDLSFICMTFLHCVFLNVSSNCLPEKRREKRGAVEKMQELNLEVIATSLS